MTAKKRIGLYIPAKGSVSYLPGFVPIDVIDEFVSILHSDPAIECFTDIDLSYAVIKNGKVYTDNHCLSDLDLFFWLFIPSADLASYELTLLKTLARRTKVVPNPFGVEHGLDKFTSHTLLSNAGLPTAEFAMFRSDMVNEMRRLLEEWGCLLLKPPLGSFGHGITMVSSPQQLVDCVEYAASFHSKPINIFCERFEPNDIEKWISTTLFYGELIYGYRKRPEKFVEGWKVYDSKRLGGEAGYVDPSPVANLVIDAAHILKVDLIGFDCIFSKRLNKYIIVDENTLPGMYPECFTAAGKGSWAEYLARLVFGRLAAS